MSDLTLHKFTDPFVLGDGLATRVCEALSAAIERRGTAVLAVSGGVTPKIFFRILSKKPISWHNVMVTLVDERWVGEDHERSNGRLVKDTLLVNRASCAGFVPLFVKDAEIDEALDGLEADIAALPAPFDVVILGMGNDGHTASYFPGGDHLDAAVDPGATHLLSTMRAAGAGEPRITLTLPVLIEAGFLALHIEGDEKMRVLLNAQETGAANAMPIRHILRAQNRLEIFWTA